MAEHERPVAELFRELSEEIASTHRMAVAGVGALAVVILVARRTS
jgi:hypothetical protein